MAKLRWAWPRKSVGVRAATPELLEVKSCRRSPMAQTIAAQESVLDAIPMQSTQGPPVRTIQYCREVNCEDCCMFFFAPQLR